MTRRIVCRHAMSRILAQTGQYYAPDSAVVRDALLRLYDGEMAMEWHTDAMLNHDPERCACDGTERRSHWTRPASNRYTLEVGPQGHHPTLNQCRRLAKRLMRAIKRKGLTPMRTRFTDPGIVVTYVGHVAVVTQYRIDRDEFWSTAMVDVA